MISKKAGLRKKHLKLWAFLVLLLQMTIWVTAYYKAVDAYATVSEVAVSAGCSQGPAGGVFSGQWSPQANVDAE